MVPVVRSLVRPGHGCVRGTAKRRSSIFFTQELTMVQATKPKSISPMVKGRRKRRTPRRSKIFRKGTGM
jgi:hypothetical protein